MGNGIAHVFAQHGHQVSLIDIEPKALEQALQTIAKNLDRQISKGIVSEKEKSETLNRIQLFSDLAEGVSTADLVVEAATEDEKLKLALFRELDIHSPQKALLASNTSSISITKLAAATSRPEKVIGMHFMNPVPVMRLVEVIEGYHTDRATTQAVVDLAKALDKEAVVVQDYPGFVANRILMPMINEAIYTLHEGVAGVEEIDQVMKLGMSHPMGPLQLADFIGLDICLAILRVLQQGFGHPKYSPCPLLTNMVEAGSLGVKSGEGFYRYSKGTKEVLVATRFLPR